MKMNFKRITALALVLLMTASLLASCSGGGEKEGTVVDVGGIPVYEHYISQKVDLGLAESETVFDIIEINGQLRATIGVLDPECDLSEYYGTPYLTEYRWYSMDFVEDTAKREKTKAHQEIIRVSDPNVDFVLGGEPEENEYGDGLDYDFYRDGEPIGEEIIPPVGINDPDARAYYSSSYSPLAHVLFYEEVVYAWINCGIQSNGVTYRDDWYNDLYVNGKFIDTYAWKPGMPKDFGFFGIIGMEGVPYALLSADGKGRLAPLTPETTELPTEGKVIDVIPTGGACSDERFGYFMSNTELWRTDGEECVLLVDMVVYGAINTSGLRAVRSLSDGRILVVIDGKLIELTGSEEAEKKDVQICNVGVYDFCREINGEIEFFELLLAKYNEISENTVFQVKRYDNIANLNLAVLTGDISMVITQDRFALNNYVKQGFLADLEEVAPKLFEKDLLVKSVVDTARVEGVCYYLPRVFTISGQTVTDPSLIPDGKLFETREEYCDFITQNDPDYFKKKTAGDIFEIFARDLEEWIDWDANTCHFDDGEFETILEFCNQGAATREEVYAYFEPRNTLEANQARDWVAGSFDLRDAVESYRFTDLEKALDYQKSIPKAKTPNDGPTTWVQVDFPMPSKVYDGFEIAAENFYAIVEDPETQKAAGDLLTWLILEDVQEKPDPTRSPMAYSLGSFSIYREENDWYLNILLDGY
ncbi:MAG: hypothetical protein E7428_07960, partial [Ruminococcaceae bacterium]|nr:hypothetical protein [Oscillospiraceae bacterium]